MKFNLALYRRYLNMDGYWLFIAVIKRYKKDLLKVTDIVIADAFFSIKTSMSGEDVLRTYIAKLIFDKCRRIPNRKLISHTIKELFGWQRKAA